MRDADWKQWLQGRFIVFDGPDGAGKTTQYRRFVEFAHGRGVTSCEVREPGGTAIGEAVRQVLLDPQYAEMDVLCEMLLYMASRAQLVAERIGPAREAGELVLADRFISSTLAYQGTAGGLPIEQIMAVGKIAMGEHWPDLVVIFDVDAATAASRLSPLLDRMEAKGSSFHRTVRQGYLDQAARDPARHLVIDATADADTVTRRLHAGLAEKLAGMAGVSL